MEAHEFFIEFESELESLSYEVRFTFDGKSDDDGLLFFGDSLSSLLLLIILVALLLLLPIL